MTTTPQRCTQVELVASHALQALPPDQAVAMDVHLAGCTACRREFEQLGQVLGSFVAWPTDVLRPPAALQARLAERLAAETGGPLVAPPPRQYREPAWEEVAPGISVKMLAMDHERHMVSMLVRLVPGGEYPPHTHAGVEELHLLDGELWIDERKLFPGDYNLGQPGTGDKRVWSETGCTCVLVTSTRDVLG
jgi:anti-sigma factor ChrR (cupin superfamily)